MSSAQFDPCRQWLGIDAVDLSDPRRVLGILPSEMDPIVVLRAADARLKLLRGIAPGPFDMARNAIIKRVEDSREAVLSQIAAAPKAPLPVGTAFTMPSPPSGPGRPAGVAMPAPPVAGRPLQPPQVPMVPQLPMAPAVPTQAVPQSPWGEAANKSDDGGFVAVKTRIVYRKQSGNAFVLVLLLALLAAAAGGLGWYWKNGRLLKTELTMTRGTNTKKSSADALAATPKRQPQPEPQPEPQPRRKQRRTEDRAMRAPDPAAASEDKPAGDPADVPEPPPAPEEPFTAEPTPTKSSDAPMADAAGTEALVPCLEKGLMALQQGDFAGADEAFAQASDKPMDKAAAERLARWQELATYAKGFADYRVQALEAVRSGVEYQIDGKVVAIVEIDDEKIMYRVTGRNKTVPRSKIPGKLLLAIVTGWFDENAANHLYLGAFHATKTEPDLTQAREAWRQAERGGADASGLLPLLDDPVLVKAAGVAADRDDQ
jgi:hypothetical protein